ncbi:MULTISPECIES: response regulator transcription factor [Cryobacterium]|jgi:two-component system OmpR family response regulator|uniref:Response regulator transcription factor n=4 Tax=Cryobacterium TaxID=69578 RepID=A0AA41UEI8_9MICO|nr:MULTISPECIES: response regulator transcription factor [Cryobacterium]MCI4657097.1 response regulator transcription factor [Cryobacterium zhongshanensis]MDY7528521.1 response regulator transcription factor [Cryobacterium sp. 10C2]MDY7540969.1 response regulator transcription factor [Cryobacterium sp. 5B3]MDY7555740.1 response regulator transcription factor [Cryobacterium sp. 10C3]MEA9998984.1 response regulator transcription factor [Cryobacterium sp. RTS3]
MTKILVVEDDEQMGALIERGLEAEGYEIVRVGNGMDALIAINNNEFDLAAIDVMLPQMTGFEICRRIRDSGNTMPVLLLTARDTVDDRVFGLDSGADDYLTKPFAFLELTARVRALLRRQSMATPLSLELGNLAIDSRDLKVTVAGRSVSMSPKEVALLRLLCSRAGTTVDRTTILEEIWNGTEHIDPNIVDQYISYLRRKIDSAAAGMRIVTVRGSGYAVELVE